MAGGSGLEKVVVNEDQSLQGLDILFESGSPLEETLLRTAACLDARLVVYQLAQFEAAGRVLELPTCFT